MRIFTQPPVHILLIEDNPADVRLTREAFQDSSPRCDLSVIADGDEAISFLRKQGAHVNARDVDLILLDLNLPKKDGREVLQETKSDSSLVRIPVLVLTTSNAEQDVLAAYDSHANSYITKPTTLPEFLALGKTIKGFWLNHVKLPTVERVRY